MRDGTRDRVIGANVEMAMDLKTSEASAAVDSPAIENEIPTYRAISPLAIISAILGAASVFSFASSFFWLFAIAAVVSGAIAAKRIATYSDVYTGVNFARVGIALGLIFGLSSFTSTQVNDFIRTRKAEQFAKKYVETLNKGDLADAIYLRQPPQQRKGHTPAEMMNELMKQAASNQAVSEMVLGPIKSIKARMQAAGGQKIEYLTIVNHGTESTESFANIVLRFAEYRGPAQSIPEQFALLTLMTQGSNADWYVKEINFPYAYNPNATPVEKLDDGHGHGDQH
jgi:hypothetical protein